MKIKAFGKTDIGRKRRINQDSLLLDEALGLFVVADGMGGHKGGEVASRLAVEGLSAYCKTHRGDLEVRALLEGGINQACSHIHQKAQANEDLTGMGTTIVSLFFDKQQVYIGHVGDSRCYLFRNPQIWQVTEDHSLVNEEIRAGRLSAAQAEDFQFKNVITRSVGYEGQVNVDTLKRDLLVGDTFLLCSDGLSGLVQMNEIAAELSQPNLEKAVTNLVDLANARGGEDNITVVCAQVESL